MKLLDDLKSKFLKKKSSSEDEDLDIELDAEDASSEPGGMTELSLDDLDDESEQDYGDATIEASVDDLLASDNSESPADEDPSFDATGEVELDLSTDPDIDAPTKKSKLLNFSLPKFGKRGGSAGGKPPASSAGLKQKVFRGVLFSLIAVAGVMTYLSENEPPAPAKKTKTVVKNKRRRIGKKAPVKKQAPAKKMAKKIAPSKKINIVKKSAPAKVAKKQIKKMPTSKEEKEILNVLGSLGKSVPKGAAPKKVLKKKIVK
ncbi:MAG: hypothetical protein HOE90_06935, partial [Bacteriovoracaceae bacterium]|nr:hypothetical protein [Bacteriovoracaceae bacterium]